MLINNDIIELKSIVIDVKKREVHINNCDIIINVEIKFSKSIICSIYLRKTIVISSRTKMLIVIHHFDVLKSQNFLFEFKNNISLIFYASMINVFTKTIIARNDNDKLI